MNKLCILVQPGESKLCGLAESRIPGFLAANGDTEVIAVDPNNYTIPNDFWDGTEFVAVVPSYYPMVNEHGLSVAFACAADSKTGISKSEGDGSIRALHVNPARRFRTFAEIYGAPCDAVFGTKTQWLYDTRTVPERIRALNLLKSVMALRLADAGVMVMDEHSTLISPEAVIGEGTVIYPGCVIEGPTVVGRNCVVGMHSRLINMKIGDNVFIEHSVLTDSEAESGVKIGPFAYIRPGTLLKQNVKVGDFVEIKNSTLGEGTKVSHLSYVGDSDFGRDINVGCGVVTCNYDGVMKHRSTVRDGAFIGSNVNLVSPVTIGENAYIATGSTITHDIPDGVLAIARSRQVIKENWKRPEKQAPHS